MSRPLPGAGAPTLSLLERVQKKSDCLGEREFSVRFPFPVGEGVRG
jgi:hypothetical protein